MPLSSLIRAVAPVRKPADAVAVALPPLTQEQPTSSGLVVSPVHGRHCICERCAPGRLEQLRLSR